MRPLRLLPLLAPVVLLTTVPGASAKGIGPVEACDPLGCRAVDARPAHLLLGGPPAAPPRSAVAVVRLRLVPGHPGSAGVPDALVAPEARLVRTFGGGWVDPGPGAMAELRREVEGIGHGVLAPGADRPRYALPASDGGAEPAIRLWWAAGAVLATALLALAGTRLHVPVRAGRATG